MVTRTAPVDPGHPADPDWLPAGELHIDEAHTGTLAFNRFGDARLSITLDGPAGTGDLATVRRAAELLPHLSLKDLADPDAYRERHGREFELPKPLSRRRFNQLGEVRVSAEPGGVRLPRNAGPMGVPVVVRRVRTEDGAADEESGWDRAMALAEQGGAAVGRGLRVVERAVVKATRLDADLLCSIALSLAVALFVGAFVWQGWANHERFGTYGFDLGIYDQGTWLLSRPAVPFVTIRGLNLFGDHASYILLLVAPLYRLWADPRLLLLLQVLALAVPALVIFRLGSWRLGHAGYGLALAVAYLALPATQWPVLWQFHPETLAAGLLAVAVLAAEERRPWLMGVMLGLALLAHEEVGLVVAGFGGLLWLTGRGAWGRRVMAAGLAWFVVATFVLIPLVNGGGSPYLAKDFGIDGADPLAVLLAVPQLLGRMVVTAFGNDGLVYLTLIFVPLALLPLRAPRWLLPVAVPIMLNLAAVNAYRHSINYQYLAASVPLLGIAAIYGLEAFARRRRTLAAPMAIVVVVLALAFNVQFGPGVWSDKPLLGPPPVQAASRLAALRMIPAGAPVSAQYNLVSHLAHRPEAYEFPNPFRASNWGLPGDEHDPLAIARVRWILVEPSLLGEDDQATLRELRENGQWERAFERDGVLLLRRKDASVGTGDTP